MIASLASLVEVRCTCRTVGGGTCELRANADAVTVSVQRGAALVATIDAMPKATHWRLAGSTVHRTDSRRVTVARGGKRDPDDPVVLLRRRHVE